MFLIKFNEDRVRERERERKIDRSYESLQGGFPVLDPEIITLLGKERKREREKEREREREEEGYEWGFVTSPKCCATLDLRRRNEEWGREMGDRGEGRISLAGRPIPPPPRSSRHHRTEGWSQLKRGRSVDR